MTEKWRKYPTEESNFFSLEVLIGVSLFPSFLLLFHFQSENAVAMIVVC